MQQFSIKDMERLSGIKAHTLRIWEHRYGILRPLRNDGNHRFYSNEDLKILLRVVFLYGKGQRIGDIACLSQDKIQQLLDQEQQNGRSVQASIVGLTEAILDFDEEAMDKIFRRISRQFGFSGAMLEVVFPMLNQLGQLWMTDRLAPGQEHFASNFILRKTLHAKNEIEKTTLKKQGLVMLFTPTGEFHEIGLLFMSYLLNLNGFNTVYIGANASLEVIEMFYQKRRPTHFFVYLTSNLQDVEPEEYLRLLVTRYPDAGIVAGGKVVSELPQIPSCKLLRKGNEMLHFSRNINMVS